jgi:hypothetical protein
VLLRVAQAIKVDPDELFEAAGYPTVRTLKQIYQGYESTIDEGLLRYLALLPRDRQRRLLLLLEGMEKVLVDDANGGGSRGLNGAGVASPGEDPDSVGGGVSLPTLRR